MKRIWIPWLLSVLMPMAVRAADWAADAELGYQSYAFDDSVSAGFRQKYNLRLSTSLNPTTTLTVFARGEDYSGDSGVAGLETRSDRRQIQPGAILAVAGEKLTLVARGELQKIATGVSGTTSDRSIENVTGNMEWRPDHLPRFNVSYFRSANEDDRSRVNLTDENAAVRAVYEWRTLSLTAEGRRLRSTDLAAGYDRSQSARRLELGYSSNAFDERLLFGVVATAETSEIDEYSSGSSIPTPVTIARASNGIDDTPSDNRDRPLVPNAALIDRDLSTSAGISVGPDGESFNNVALEMGRLEKLDEIRVIVRDESGNPLQIGGGAVEWDVWTSDDGQLWSQVAGATTTFNRPLSLYSVRFDQLSVRWIKVVNFGVNVGSTFVTEVEAYYFAPPAPGDGRKSTRNEYRGAAHLSTRPTRNLTLSYDGVFNTQDELSGPDERSSTTTDHSARVRYSFRLPFSLRGEYLSSQNETTGEPDQSTATWSGYMDWEPTDRLRLTARLQHQDQSTRGDEYVLRTVGLYADTWVFRSLSVSLDAGTRTETPKVGTGSGVGTFLSLTSRAQLTRTFSMSVLASLNRVRGTNGYTPVFLGAGRDDRVSTGFFWRPGRPLSVITTIGWFQGERRSGTTGRIRVDWYPFGDGTVVVGAHVDRDIDTATDREVTRAQFEAGWRMNRHATFQITYNAVLTTNASAAIDQKTLFASLKLRN